MELSATARVVLGMLAAGPKSGYEIKAIVDRSTRFFWAASYGQIYPELRRLAAAGLIAEAEAADGPRRRRRHRLTARGRHALASWLRDADELHELRDEALLKLFFAGHLDRADAIGVLERKRTAHADAARHLREEIEPLAASVERYGPHAALRFGVAFNEFAAEWCERELAELRNGRSNAAFAAKEG
jgi:PadR family transcriptional regulator, regulatory protein AphA